MMRRLVIIIASLAFSASSQNELVQNYWSMERVTNDLISAKPGRWQHAPVYVQGARGQEVVCTNGQYFLMTNTCLTNVVSEFTIFARWGLRRLPTGNSGTSAFVVVTSAQAGATDNYASFQLRHTSNSILFLYAYTNAYPTNAYPFGQYQIEFTNQPQAGRSYAAAGVVQSNNAWLYVDGRLCGQQTVSNLFTRVINRRSAITANAVLEAGTVYYTNNYGSVDEIMFSTNALNSAQVQLLCNGVRE